MLIPEHDVFAARPVLVLLKLELPEVALGLLAVFGLDALQILPKAKRTMPGG